MKHLAALKELIYHLLQYGDQYQNTVFQKKS